jgi:hypothetical protein
MEKMIWDEKENGPLVPRFLTRKKNSRESLAMAPANRPQLGAVFTDLFGYGIAQHINISDLRKLIVLNKDVNQVVKGIVYTNNHRAILNRVDDEMNVKMYMDGIKYINIIESSVKYQVFDNLAEVIAMSSEEERNNKLDLIFNYSIACKRIIRKYRDADSDDISDLVTKMVPQTPIFEISATSHQDRDFKIFQFLLYMTSKYMKGKSSNIAQVSLLQQMMSYFDGLYMSRLAAICSEETYKKIEKISRKDRDIYQKVFVSFLWKQESFHLDINIYNIYSLYMSDVICKAYPKHIPVSVANGIVDHDLIAAKSYYCIAEGEKQVATITFMLELVAEGYFKRIQMQLIGMIFNYISDIIANNVIASSLTKNSMNFFKVVLGRCEAIAEDIHHTTNYSQELVDIVSNILAKTKHALIETIPL